MSDGKIKINGTGCALADFLFTKVRFDTPQFSRFMSSQAGDGGLDPGKLVFTEELEDFSDKPYPEILKEITGNIPPDTINIVGPGLVSLIHASQFLPGSEFEVCFFGGTGHDETADKIFRLVRKTPLNISNYKKISRKATSFTDVFSDPTFDDGHGERTFVNNIGAAWDYSLEMLSEDFFDAQIVCFGGTALVPQIHDNLTLLLKKAKAKNCITVVNTVFDFRNEKDNPGKHWPLGNSEESFRLIDVLIMDKVEALKISGKISTEEVAEYFANQQVPSFFITNGSNDIIAYSNGGLFQKSDIKKFPVSEKIISKLEENPELKGDTTG